MQEPSELECTMRRLQLKLELVDLRLAEVREASAAALAKLVQVRLWAKGAMLTDGDARELNEILDGEDDG